MSFLNSSQTNWSNLDIVTQKSSSDLGRPIRLIGVQSKFSSETPLHGKPFINTQFHRFVLAQTLNINPSDQTKAAVWVSKFSQDGLYMATGDQYCMITVWKVLDSPKNSINLFYNSPYRIYSGHSADIIDISWSQSLVSVFILMQSNLFFISGSMDSKIRLWNIHSKKVMYWNQIPQERVVTAVGFSINGKTICAGTNTGHVFFFDTQLRYTTQVLIKNKRCKKGKKVTGIEYMPNLPTGEERLLVTTNDSKLWMLNMKDKSVVYKYKGLENSSMQIKASFSDDGRSIVSGSEDGRVYLWSTDQITYFPFPDMYDNRLKSAILSNTRDHSTKLFNEKHHFEGRLQGMLNREQRLFRKLKKEKILAHQSPVTTTCFAPTKTKQLLAKSKCDIIIDHTPVYAYKQNSLDIALPEERVQYNFPNSQIIVSADIHGLIKIWRMDSGLYPVVPSIPSKKRLSAIFNCL